jgi:hypothetical protein
MALPAVERRNFKIGKYDIVAQPAVGSAHMLRYTILLNGKRLGALLSVPTESDCRFLESPPAVPPVKIFQVTHRPGRPKKNAVPPAAQSLSEPGPRGLRHDDLPPGTLPLDIKRPE